MGVVMGHSEFHAQRMMKLKQAIEEGRRKQARVFGALARECEPVRQPGLGGLSQDQLSALVFTGGQLDQVEKTRELLLQMVKLVEAVNVINGAFGLGLPPLLSCEITTHLVQLDRRICQAVEAAKLAGMPEVAKKIATVQARQRPPVLGRQ